MRKEAALDLLAEAKEVLQIISTYKKISRPKVKSIFEHLRSTLEYVAQDINGKLSTPKDRLYFPYGKTKKIFDDSVKKSFPLLINEMPEIYNEISKLQFFVSGDEWLVDLCSITNILKHDNAVDIRKDSIETKSVSVIVDGYTPFKILGDGAGVQFRNININDKLMDSFIITKDEIEITQKGEIPTLFKITKNRKILIGEKELDLLVFLNKCIINIENFVEVIYDKLEKI